MDGDAPVRGQVVAEVPGRASEGGVAALELTCNSLLVALHHQHSDVCMKACQIMGGLLRHSTTASMGMELG